MPDTDRTSGLGTFIARVVRLQVEIATAPNPPQDSYTVRLSAFLADASEAVDRLSVQLDDELQRMAGR